MKRILCFIFIMGLLYGIANARLGGAGATFLSLGGGSRPLALGGAYVAFAEGIDALYWNPAGIANINKTNFSFTHAELFADMSYENIAFVYPLGDAAVGISILAFLSGDIEETTLEYQEGTGDHFSCNDFAVGITYGRMMTKRFTAGATARVINQNIWKCSATGVAFDLGATYNTGIRNLKFGFVVQNFGSDLVYSGEDLEGTLVMEGYENIQESDIPYVLASEPYPLPLTFQLGVSIDALYSIIHRITVEADLIHPNDQNETYAAGVEYCYNNMFFLRGGHTQKNCRLWSTGFGVKLANMKVDYSYEHHRYLVGIHRISAGFSY